MNVSPTRNTKDLLARAKSRIRRQVPTIRTSVTAYTIAQANRMTGDPCEVLSGSFPPISRVMNGSVDSATTKTI